MSRVLKINQGDYTLQVSEAGSIIFDTTNIVATGNVEIAKNLEVTGDIYVTGVPYGTAPVVGHVLHVTTNGKDTNDGSAQDPSRACRTIGGAINSPLYQSGTSIKVAAGHYLEHNPLVMKPYTSIIGSDLRTTAIEPINKTQDLFHVASSCYIAQLQIINGRSGIVDPYIDRGAYAVSFPLLPADGKKLDVYKSPYIQNCTNQSGPWMYDGAMFVPNQTVQIPKAVGTTTFVEGESIISVTIGYGASTFADTATGMAINTAPQHLGFFTARTLILANIEFIQQSVLNSLARYTITYSKEKCSRDIAIIIKAILYDATFGGNSKSVEAGTAYWNGTVRVIPDDEKDPTLGALDTMYELLGQILGNQPQVVAQGHPVRYYNTSLATDGTFALQPLKKCIDIIKSIIADRGSPAIYYTTGPEFGLVSAEELIHANRAFIVADVIATIDGVNGTYGYDVKTCERDIGFIIDALRYDMLFSKANTLNTTDGEINFQSIIAGRAYARTSPYVRPTAEVDMTINALGKLSTLLQMLVYRNNIAVHSIVRNMKHITDIIRTPGTTLVLNIGNESSIATKISAYANFIQAEVAAYLTSNHAVLYANIINKAKCIRDVTYVLDAIRYDATYGGNVQSIIAGEAYYAYTQLVIPETELTAILAVFELIGDIVYSIGEATSTYTQRSSQTKPPSNPALKDEATLARALVNDIRTIIEHTHSPAKIYPDISQVSAANKESNALLVENMQDLQGKITRYISSENNVYGYDKTLCKRDIGYIIDAIAYDTILGGNSKSVEAGLGYFTGTKRVVCDDEVPKIIDALTRMKVIMPYIVANVSSLANSAGTPTPLVSPASVLRVIAASTTPISANTPMDKNFGIIATSSIDRNLDIIANIIKNGPHAIPKRYTGTALFAATGVSLDDVQQSTTVVSVRKLQDYTWEIELSSPTVGIGNHSTLYFGSTNNYPIVESSMSPTEEERWGDRKLDPWGAMGGMLIDGAVVSKISPVRSFVADAFTQVNQGGRGIRVTNNGYVQLVSVFTIFSSIAVQADNGGIASVTNSNTNFGKYCMISTGYGVKEFSGTIYNPPVAPLYPRGFYPSNAKVEVFVPDLANRPHIALIMEVEPPPGHTNAYGLPGFISSAINFSTILEGTLSLTDIDITDMYIGQTVILRDLYGRYIDPITNEQYLPVNTVISYMDPSTLYLSSPINITAGAVAFNQATGSCVRWLVTMEGDATTSGLQLGTLVVGLGIVANTAVASIESSTTFKITIDQQFTSLEMRFYTPIPNYFTLYTSGNAYYNVLSSVIKENPPKRSDGSTITYGENELVLPTDQRNLEVNAINTIKAAILGLNASLSAQVITRVDALFKFILDSVNGFVDIANTTQAAIAIRRSADSTETGALTLISKTDNWTTPLAGKATEAGSLAKLIVANISKIVAATVDDEAVAAALYNTVKCKRDVQLICNNIALDLLSGGNYNSIYSGLSYYSRIGSYHVVDLENQVRDPMLFPDGAIVNFYQRSYITASGYLFEYIGAGTNYGALPQVGRADPVQANEVNMLNGGKVFFTSTDQSGDFRIGTGLVISQANGVLRGRTFQKSLFAEMTPFILALEG